MRIGDNPQKFKKRDKNYYFHKVVIPVYIPNFDGYFKDSFEILKICFESLFKTSHKKTFFSIINNGSCKEVETYLNELYANKKIHEITHTSAIGKLNAVFKGVAGDDFDIITISDADVLFLNNWQEEVYKIFNTFPQAGAVGTTPDPNRIKYFNSIVYFQYFFSNKLRFKNVKNRLAMKKFALSLGYESYFKTPHLEKYITITKEKVTAVIGTGHYTCSYRKEVFSMIPKYAESLLGDETYFIDKPVMDKGFWRLTTNGNYTYHLGNVIENWMNEELNLLHDIKNDTFEKFTLNKAKPSNKVIVFLSIYFMKPIYKFRFLWNIFLVYKGLNFNQAKKY